MCLFVYTDGACKKNGDGGWAFVAVSNGKEVHRESGYVGGTTNNRMELWAILRALAWCRNYVDNVIIVTDSRYAITVMERYPKVFDRNSDLIKQARQLRAKVQFEWIRGHSGNEWNDFADKLATEARAGVDAQAVFKPRSDPYAVKRGPEPGSP